MQQSKISLEEIKKMKAANQDSLKKVDEAANKIASAAKAISVLAHETVLANNLSKAFISEFSTGIARLDEEVKRCQDEIIKIRPFRRHIDEALDNQLHAAIKLTGHPAA